jgi:hypothetical protein
MTAFDRLEPKQRRAVAALIAEPSIAAAARVSGLGERTLRRWLAEPTFAEAVQQESERAFGQILEHLRAGALDSVAFLRETVRNPTASEGARVRAAATLLAAVTRAIALSAEARSVLEEPEKHDLSTLTDDELRAYRDIVLKLARPSVRTPGESTRG